MKDESETTFKQTSEYLISHGWEMITLKEYLEEKKLRKYQTARIGSYHYFKLKKSNEEILMEKE